jgi:hypothetical protein
MQHHYSIARNADGTWVIGAEGRGILQCANEIDAVKTAQDANELAATAAPNRPDRGAETTAA